MWMFGAPARHHGNSYMLMMLHGGSFLQPNTTINQILSTSDPESEITIRDLVNLIQELTGYGGKVHWDTTKPDGQPKRRLNVNRAKEEFGFVAQMPFRKGLAKTIQWYQEHAGMLNESVDSEQHC